MAGLLNLQGLRPPRMGHPVCSPNCTRHNNGQGQGMASKTRPRTYFKVTFNHQNEVYQVCARTVSASDLWGLIEISGFIFRDTGVLYNPGEERLRKEFEGISRTMVPYHAILRIDEVEDATEREIKIVPLESPPPVLQMPPRPKRDI